MSENTQDDSAIYLVEEELALLTSAAKKNWEKFIKMETFTAYETPAQIDARMRAVSYKKYPAVQNKIDAYIADMKAGKQVELSFDDFPEEALSSFLFSIGASGISALIDLYLHDPTVQDHPEIMEGIAALTRARHGILEKNEAVFA